MYQGLLRVWQEKPANVQTRERKKKKKEKVRDVRASPRNNNNNLFPTPWVSMQCSSSIPTHHTRSLSVQRSTFLFLRLESIALQALLARLAASHRLPPHSAISSSGSSLLLGTWARAFRTHRPGTGERVAAAGTTDVDDAGRGQLGGGGRLWGKL